MVIETDCLSTTSNAFCNETPRKARSTSSLSFVNGDPSPLKFCNSHAPCSMHVVSEYVICSGFPLEIHGTFSSYWSSSGVCNVSTAHRFSACQNDCIKKLRTTKSAGLVSGSHRQLWRVC